MTVDREQVRRNARTRLVLRVRTAQVLPHRGHDGLPGSPDKTCVRCNADRAFDALLAELEQAERERDEALEREKVTEAHLANALADVERERDEALKWWNLEAIKRLEARLTAVSALVEALRAAEHHLDCVDTEDDAIVRDAGTDTVRVYAAKQALREGRIAYEQAQEQR